jgi:hypothetical protein
MPGSAETAALARVPDLAQSVDTRGMLLSGFAHVRFNEPANHVTDGFVVILPPRALVSAVGRPTATLLLTAAQDLSHADVLCPIEDADYTQQALPGWRASCAILHGLPETMRWEHTRDEDTTLFTRADAPPLTHLPDDLQREITEALRGMPLARFGGKIDPAGALEPAPRPLPVAAAWADGIPVSFCYPVVQTETFWDISIDTLEAYRGRGLAARAVRAMIRHMRRAGKAPVWGALDTNASSLTVARKLGFVEVGRLGVFTSR